MLSMTEKRDTVRYLVEVSIHRDTVCSSFDQEVIQYLLILNGVNSP